MTHEDVERISEAEQAPPVLVIDDDEAFVKIASVVLRSHGYRVLTADNSEDGLRMMRQQPPMIVVLDVMMRYMLEGVDLAQQMLADEKLRTIPVLMVSSIANTESICQFTTEDYLNADDFLTKPVAPDQLVERVRRLAKRPCSTRPSTS